MARRRARVLDLALECRRDPEEVTIILLSRGLDVNSPQDIIPKSKYQMARRVLGLGSQRYTRTLSSIVEETGIPRDELRQLLSEQRITLDSNEVVPRSRMRQLYRAISANLAQAKQAAQAPETVTPQRLVKEQAVDANEIRKQAARSKWRIIGKPEELAIIGPGDVEAIHYSLVKDYARSRDPIDPPGIRARSLLESAVHRPYTSLGAIPKYPTASMAGAALLHALIHDHPFHNGNKRTAIVSLLVFLDRNKYVLTADDDDLFAYVIELSGHSILPETPGRNSALADLEMQHAARWIQRNMRKVQKGEFCLKFHEFRSILTARDCEIDIIGGNRANIRCGDRQVQIFYGDEGRDVPPNTIHMVRRGLGLDEEHGFDSDVFYNASDRIGSFINKHRKALDRLAKM